MLKSLDARGFFLFLVPLLILTILAVLFDIPVLRQVASFIFLTFVPGFLIFHILKLNRMGLVEKIVLSVGLSVVFSMLFGLVVNSSLLALGYARPLSTTPLLISFSLATIVLATFAYIRNRDITLSFSALKLATREKALLIVPALFPLLSIVGMRVMNLTDNNVLIILLLVLIPAYVIFISFYHGKASERLYPLLIFLIGVSLVLLQALRSDHVVGSDVHQMYAAFQSTLDKLHYSVTTPSLVDSLVSVTIFPAIYQAFLKINPEYLFKILIPLFFSISPLVVYVIARKYIGGFYAFLTSFLFLSQTIFFRATDFASTTLAILFFALAIMVLFHDGINEFGRRLLFILFAVACVVSHYSTSLIFLFILLLTWIGMSLLNSVYLRRKKRQALSKIATRDGNLEDHLHVGNPPDSAVQDYVSTSAKTSITSLKASVSVTAVVLLLVIFFFWYSQITISPFNIAVGVIQKTWIGLFQSFELEMRDTAVSAAMGQMAAPTIWKAIRLVVYWLEIVFIAIGVLSIAARYKSTVAYSGSGTTKISSLESKIKLEYLVLSAVGAIIMASAVILPYISIAYTLWRSYFQSLVFLSLYFAIGVVLIASWLRMRAYLIMLGILIPFFMFSTGLVEYAYGIPSEIWLNTKGSAYEKWYVSDEDSYAAQWIANYRQAGATVYSAGEQGALILTSQGRFPYVEMMGHIFHKHPSGEVNSCIFLREHDIVVGKILENFADMFATKSKIYTTGASEIYR